MKRSTALIIAFTLLMTLALPLFVPSGAMLVSRRDRLLEKIWEAEDEFEGGLIDLFIPRAAAEGEEPASLPVDFSPGMPLDPAGFSETGYLDKSIELKLETLERDGVQYRIAYVSIAHPSQLRTATAGKPTSSRVALISSMAEKNNAVIAVNANYMSNDPVKTSFEYRMGERIRAKLNRAKDLLIIDQNADFHLFIKSKKEEVADFQNAGFQIVNAFTFGPALVKDGQLLEMDQEYGYNPHGKEPRMAIGQIGPLYYVLVHAEGRMKESEGVTHQELADFMFDIGCQQAFNLDGGNSSTLVFNGGYYQNKTKDNERAQSDMIYFASAVHP